MGQGRRIPIVDTTQVEVSLETGTYECSGVVKNDDGSRSRGYKLATLRTLLDHAGLITQVGLCPIPTTSFDFPLYMPSCIRHDYLSICLICNVPQLL